MKFNDPYQIEWKSDRKLSKNGKEWYIIISIKNLKLGMSKVVQVVPEKVATGIPFDNYKNWRRIVENFEEAKKLVWHFEPTMLVKGEPEPFGPDRSGNLNADAIIFSYGETVKDYKKSKQPIKEVEQVTFDNDLFEMK